MLAKLEVSLVAFGLMAVISGSAPALAQPTAPYPVANFHRGAPPPPTFGGVPPASFVQLGERTVFSMRTVRYGLELWVTNGTPEGTELLVDICPGACGVRRTDLLATSDRLFFDLEIEPLDGFGRSYNSLWVTDGTVAGTYPLGSYVASPVAYVEATGRFFFARSSRELGQELWVTDGTTEGTRLVRDIYPGVRDSGPGEGGALGNRAIFPATAPGLGRQLWTSDGTEEGTRLLFELNEGSAALEYDTFRRVGDRLLYAGGPRFNLGLWSTDGTTDGTQKLVDRFFRSSGFSSTAFHVGGSRAYFTRGGTSPEVWSSDGSVAGTYRLSPEGMLASGVRPFGGGAVFMGQGAFGDLEPWISDGTPSGSRQLLDLCPGECSSGPSFGAEVAGEMYFTADLPVHGRELWKTDGTVAGTRLVRDLCPGTCDTRMGNFHSAGGRLFFDADGAIKSTDGTPEGTVTLAVSFGFHSTSFHPAGSSTVFFHEPQGGGWHLRATDGTVSGTRLLTSFSDALDGNGSPSGLVELNGEVLFTAASGGDHVALKAAGDGGSTGVRDVVAFPRWFGGISPIERAGDRIFFVENYGSSAARIWVSDGTAAGSQALGDAPTLSSDSPWGSYGDDLLAFVHATGVNRVSGPPYELTELVDISSPDTAQDEDDFFLRLGNLSLFPGRSGFFATDGTPQGTFQVDAQPGLPAFLGPATGWAVHGDEAYFLTEVTGLWATDGQPGHTRQVCPSEWDFANIRARYLESIGGGLIFSIEQPTFRNEDPSGLWWSNGDSGCERIAPGVIIDSRNLLPGVTAVLDGRLLFASDDGVHGSELWVSDGTTAGTRLLADLNPGPGESRPQRMEVVGDRVYFTATDGEHGYELWTTDGTSEGTRRLGDIAPGVYSSYPDDLTAVGDTLYFSALDPVRGRELWALPLATPSCDQAGTLCLQDDRFRVQAHWRDQRTGNVGVGTALPFPGSDLTGMFWFFDADNVELIVKVLDAGSVNGFHWMFYGSLSDVEYWLTVTDSVTGDTRLYRNPPGELCGRGDTTAFPSTLQAPGAGSTAAPITGDREASAADWRPVEIASPIELIPSAADPRPGANESTAGSCAAGDEALCLLGERFRIEVEWRDHRSGDTGVGTAIPGSDKSGFFWFFNSANVELVVKMLDARVVNGRYWVFYGGLSDVEYTIRVRDTETGAEAAYTNPPGEICGGADTSAF